MMEFNEKLQALRKQKQLTQEELAEVLYVSRAAVAKWEAGRGYPNIDSLKAISGYFGVSIDSLLSGDELLTLAQEDTRAQEARLRTRVFALLDCSAALFFLLPVFGQKVAESVQSVSLLQLTDVAPYMRMAYFAVIIGMILTGAASLILQSAAPAFWERCKKVVSLGFSVAGVLLFIISPQPYAAAFLFVFLMIKVLVLIRKK